MIRHCVPVDMCVIDEEYDKSENLPPDSVYRPITCDVYKVVLKNVICKPVDVDNSGNLMNCPVAPGAPVAGNGVTVGLTPDITYTFEYGGFI